MTAIADLTTVLTILKGGPVSNAVLLKIADTFPFDGTNEQRATAILNAMRQDIRKRLRKPAEDAVYAPVIAQAHYPADQPALIASVAAQATAAGDAAEAEL